VIKHREQFHIGSDFSTLSRQIAQASPSAAEWLWFLFLWEFLLLFFLFLFLALLDLLSGCRLDSFTGTTFDFALAGTNTGELAERTVPSFLLLLSCCLVIFALGRLFVFRSGGSLSEVLGFFLLLALIVAESFGDD
jgi:hypothetical protein